MVTNKTDEDKGESEKVTRLDWRLKGQQEPCNIYHMCTETHHLREEEREWRRQQQQQHKSGQKSLQTVEILPLIIMMMIGAVLEFIIVIFILQCYWMPRSRPLEIYLRGNVKGRVVRPSYISIIFLLPYPMSYYYFRF